MHSEQLSYYFIVLCMCFYCIKQIFLGDKLNIHLSLYTQYYEYIPDHTSVLKFLTGKKMVPGKN